MKIVVDTNIFVSGWLWGGIPARLFRLARTHQVIICACEPILAELETTLEKQKLQAKLQSLGFTVNGLMRGTRELVEVYPISTINLPELRDPNDNMILATAIAAAVDVIVTGDLDLLVLQEYEGILIVTAREFLDRYFPEN
ncbi:putative toxin-antitoxin system toxin component, PIN family [Limnofasciculus baicalensis]|uniref:Toxin-antitoxin system toxin component, PIN family n=1 Tax=Limnofasciculus baicalensis BBK-W-15 TaxID=2699891 RepID=A0AAE3GRY2_9CYAN|nr:putative toxin-antitoxin system toxin component, PIN family [Limnofasciculus baicalensis]MCP2727447.1 putative toxin-antitoxin system toxin component, PIN family [Limnofasciculus baicalensis BBK-W-15]